MKKKLGELEQIPLFDLDRGNELASVGLDMAVENADRKEKGWSTRCWQLFLYWLRRKKHKDEFMIEDFRKYLMEYDLIEDPPSLRAYGFISVRAKKAGFIQFVRTEKVKNAKAHGANASVWRRVYFGTIQ